MTDMMYLQIAEKVGAIARGDERPNNILGSTTVRLAVGLIVDNLEATNPNFGNPTKLSAWTVLDTIQRQVVADMNPEFRKRKWQRLPLPYGVPM